MLSKPQRLEWCYIKSIPPGGFYCPESKLSLGIFLWCHMRCQSSICSSVVVQVYYKSCLFVRPRKKGSKSFMWISSIQSWHNYQLLRGPQQRKVILEKTTLLLSYNHTSSALFSIASFTGFSLSASTFARPHSCVGSYDKCPSWSFGL